MGFTDEQRRKAAETRARNRQAGVAHSDAPATAVAVPESPAADEVTAELKRLAATLFNAADKQTARNAALGELEGFLSKLNPRDYPDLADSPVVQQFVEMLGQRKVEQNTDDPPGTLYNGGTMAATIKPWTEQDLRKSDMPLVEFRFDTFQDVIWNGIRRQYQPRTPYRDYRCFPDLVWLSQQSMDQAEEHVQYMMRKRNNLSDPTIAGLGTAKIRGTADQGTYTPAGGLFTPDFAQGKAEGEGEEEAA